MVPISKSIWPLILFVYANFYFVAITRFNSSFCFLKTFSQEQLKASPPNFAPPFCAFCLIVCDFLPKTWNLGRKTLPGSGLALSVTAYAVPPLPKGEALAKPETLPLCQGLSLWESWQARQGLTERASPLTGHQRRPPSAKAARPPGRSGCFGAWGATLVTGQRARPLSQALSGLPALPKGEPLA